MVRRIGMAVGMAVLLGGTLALKAAWLPLQLDAPKHTNKYDPLNPDNLAKAQATATPTPNTVATQTAVATQTPLAGPIITTVAGNGIAGYSGDGGLATAAELGTNNDDWGQPLAIDSAGNFYVGESTRVRKVTASTGIITTVAGNGTSGYSGDGGLATAAQLGGYRLSSVAVDSAGNLYIGDSANSRVRKVTASTGIITTVAGNGTYSTGYSDDGGLATAAQLGDGGLSVAVDSAGNLYIGDSANSRVLKVTASTGIITTVAGNGTCSTGYSGDGGPATAAQLSTYGDAGLPVALPVAVDSAGNFYIVDNGNNCVRKVTASTGIITTVAGNGTAGYSGDGGPATAAQLSYGGVGKGLYIAVGSTGDMYIGDYSNYRVRKVKASTGIISTVAGNGANGTYGDGGPALAAGVQPIGVALGPDGLYIAGAVRIRKVSPLP